MLYLSDGLYIVFQFSTKNPAEWAFEPSDSKQSKQCALHNYTTYNAQSILRVYSLVVGQNHVKYFVCIYSDRKRFPTPVIYYFKRIANDFVMIKPQFINVRERSSILCIL